MVYAELAVSADDMNDPGSDQFIGITYGGLAGSACLHGCGGLAKSSD